MVWSKVSGFHLYVEHLWLLAERLYRFLRPPQHNLLPCPFQAMSLLDRDNSSCTSLCQYVDAPQTNLCFNALCTLVTIFVSKAFLYNKGYILRNTCHKCKLHKAFKTQNRVCSGSIYILAQWSTAEVFPIQQHGSMLWRSEEPKQPLW